MKRTSCVLKPVENSGTFTRDSLSGKVAYTRYDVTRVCGMVDYYVLQKYTVKLSLRAHANECPFA
jgi:hypothetical protein